MNIAVFVNTEGDVHFYKNIIAALERNDHQISVLARDCPGTIDSLNELDIPFYRYANSLNVESEKITSIPEDVVNAFRYLKERHVELTTGCGIYNTFTARLLKVPDVTFNDSECSTEAEQYALLKLTRQFTNIFVTPSSFKHDFGSNHLKLESYKELAYLHPNYYTPDPSVYDLLDISKSCNYSVLRFNANNRPHEPGFRGFADVDKIDLVEELSGYADVFVLSDSQVSAQLEKYLLNVPRRRIHDVLNYASLFITDTQMAIEGALLGTPTIRIGPLIEDCDSIFFELEREFQLMYNFSTISKVVAKAVQLIKDPYTAVQWKQKRHRLLGKKLDMTTLMVSLIEEYYESVTYLRAGSGSQGIPITERCSEGCLHVL